MTRLEEKSGYNKAVVAVASGIVRYSGWTRGGWAPYGKVVYIEHDYRDHRGRRYQTLYAHLHKVKVWQGQRVQAGEIIGTVGGSSRGRYLRFGPHLHFAMYRGARPWLGGGRAVVPEPMGAYENLRKGMVLEACGRPDRQLTFAGVAACPKDPCALLAPCHSGASPPSIEQLIPARVLTVL